MSAFWKTIYGQMLLPEDLPESGLLDSGPICWEHPKSALINQYIKTSLLAYASIPKEVRDRKWRPLSYEGWCRALDPKMFDLWNRRQKEAEAIIALVLKHDRAVRKHFLTENPQYKERVRVKMWREAA